jgi:hypothetical protein
MSIFSLPNIPGRKTLVLFVIALCLFVEWIGRSGGHALENISLEHPVAGRWCFYVFLIFLIISYSGEKQQFIYFQF